MLACDFFIFLTNTIHFSASPKTSGAKAQDILHASALSLGRVSKLLFERVQASLLEDERLYGAETSYPADACRSPAMFS